VIDLVRPAIVQISATIVPKTNSDRERLGGKPHSSQPLGTGFFVSDSAHVLTAQHVMGGVRGLVSDWPDSEVNVGVGLALPNTESMRANFNIIPFEVVEEDERHDLALLRMTANPFKGEVAPVIAIDDQSISGMSGVPALQSDRPRDGESIAISGYPLGETVLVTNTGIVASSWSVTIDEIAHPVFSDVNVPQVRDTYLADVQTNPGNSGGPVYASRDGGIIGVLVAGKLTDVVAGEASVIVNGQPLRADAGLSLVVPIKYGTAMLDKHGVKWTGAARAI